MSASDTGFFAEVLALVRGIPRGRVLTYGQVAALLGKPRGARAVGWALRATGARVPWHRVLGQGGRISLDGRPAGREQRRRLRREGVRFVAGRVDLARHGLLGQSAPTRGSRSSSRARWR